MRATANPKLDLDHELTRIAWVHQLFHEEYKKTGWELDKLLALFNKKVFNHVRQDRDIYIAMTGHTGNGKSNLACQMGFMIDPNFDLNKNVIYTPTIEELREKIRYRKAIENKETLSPNALPPYSVIVIDEAIKVLYKLEQWNGVARYMKKLFNLARTENKIVILCIPDFLDMGNTFRSQMDWWIDVFYRFKDKENPNNSFAMACAEAPSPNKYTSDKWNTGVNEKHFEEGVGRRKYADLDAHDLMALYKGSKNYVASFSFKPLPPKYESEYNHLKNMHDYDQVDDAKAEDKNKEKIKTHQKTIKFLYDRLREYGNAISQNDIAEQLGVSQGTVNLMFKGVNKDVTA